MAIPKLTWASFRALCTGTIDDVATPVSSANPLPVSVISGSAAGTEYVEDAALPADPAGGALMLRQAASPASQGAANGDAVALGGTNKGEAFVKNADLETLVGGVTEAAPATDTASSGLNGRAQRIAQRITSLIALVPAALGSAAAAASFAVTLSTEDVARQGIITETAPATDTASSGQNGRLQRIAQRITSLIALVPTSLGRKAASASLAVVPAGLAYGTVAASQTGAVIGGGTGAIGDFLSHVVIQPTTTAAGTVTVLDNATTVFTFTTGTLSDLKPITVPFNAFSVSGAWKITTGANVSATGFGNFT